MSTALEIQCVNVCPAIFPNRTRLLDVSVNLIHATPTLVDLEPSVLLGEGRQSASVQQATREIRMHSAREATVSMTMNVQAIWPALTTIAEILVSAHAEEMPTVRSKITVPSALVLRATKETPCKAVNAVQL